MVPEQRLSTVGFGTSAANLLQEGAAARRALTLLAGFCSERDITAPSNVEDAVTLAQGWFQKVQDGASSLTAAEQRVSTLSQRVDEDRRKAEEELTQVKSQLAEAQAANTASESHVAALTALREQVANEKDDNKSLRDRLTACGVSLTVARGRLAALEDSLGEVVDSAKEERLKAVADAEKAVTKSATRAREALQASHRAEKNLFKTGLCSLVEKTDALVTHAAGFLTPFHDKVQECSTACDNLLRTGVDQGLLAVASSSSRGRPSVPKLPPIVHTIRKLSPAARGTRGQQIPLRLLTCGLSRGGSRRGPPDGSGTDPSGPGGLVVVLRRNGLGVALIRMALGSSTVRCCPMAL